MRTPKIRYTVAPNFRRLPSVSGCQRSGDRSGRRGLGSRAGDLEEFLPELAWTWEFQELGAAFSVY